MNSATSLNCRRCSFINPPGMRFCGNCGAPLIDSEDTSESDRVSVVRSKDHPGPQGGFNSEPSSQTTGQRRNVTILFADLAEYTSLSEKVDNEVLFNLIQKVIHIMVDVVYQYEGMVDKILGDGVMALFGAPIAHENNAERAAKAALEMQEKISELDDDFYADQVGTLKLHIGLNSGSVIVGGVGTDRLMNYTAIGDIVNIAHRLGDCAEPGEILVSASVYEATQAIFSYEMLPSLFLKGISKSIQAYRLIKPRDKPESLRGINSLVAPLVAPLVGRDLELGLLITAFHQAVEKKQPRLVLLTGEAGIGKSRLTREFIKNIEQYSPTVLEGHSLTYRRTVSYWMFMDLLRNYLGTTQSTPGFQTHERLVTKMYDRLGNQAINVIPYLEYILAIEHSETEAADRRMHLDAAQLRQQIFLAVKELILAEANRRPMVLILEDLHWADEASLDLFEYLVDRIQNVPILFLVISRTIQEEKLKVIISQVEERIGDRFTSIELQNLSIDECEQLLSALLAVSELPPHLRNQLLHKSAGIPFFLEELIRMLIDDQVIRREESGWRYLSEQGSYELGVPENINALILARFDRLNEEQRRVLRCASVIGKEFNLPTIAEAIELKDKTALHTTIDILVQKGFIIKKPGGSDTECLFRHVLTCDAVYDTLLHRDKRELHLKVGEAIEKLNGDQFGAQVELLASHFIRSDRLDKALYYLTLAGQKAAQDYANQQASSHYEEALKLLSSVPHSIKQSLQIWTGMGDVLLFTGEYSRARHFYDLAIQEIHRVGAGSFEKEYFALKCKVGTTFERQGDYQLALEYLSQALFELESSSHPYPVEKAQINNDMGWIHFLKGNFEDAQENLRLALINVESTQKYDVIASIYNRLGAVAYQERAYDRADEYVRKSLALREVIGDRAGVARLYNNLGLLGLIRGNLRDAEVNFTRSIDLLERIGDAEGIALSYINLGLVKFDRGNFNEAAQYLGKGYHAAEQIGHRFYLGLALMYIGRLQIAQQRIKEAEDNLFKSLAIFEELGVQDHLVDAQYYLIESYLEAGDIVMAGKGISRAEELLADIPENTNTGSVADGRLRKLKGMLAKLTGDMEIAEKLLLESTDIFVAADQKLESAHTLYYLSILENMMGKRQEAYHHMREARSIYDQSGADLHGRRAQDALSEIGEINLRVNLPG